MRVPQDLVSGRWPRVSLDQLQAAFAQVLKRRRFTQPVVETVAAEKVALPNRCRLSLTGLV
ncbi:MAG: hypothetical protein ACLSH6_07350 [Limosilactobacillus pontis]